MTPLILQDKIVEDLKELFAEYVYKDSYEANRPINIYAQAVPYLDSDNDDDLFPYIEVRLTDGEDDGVTHTATVVFVIGTRDSDKENQGHRDVVNIMQRIHGRYGTKPAVKDNVAYQTGKWSWALQEDTYFPYSFGAITTDFVIASIRREDEYA